MDKFVQPWFAGILDFKGLYGYSTRATAGTATQAASCYASAPTSESAFQEGRIAKAI